MTSYRYSIKVPITPEEKELFVVNKTSIDVDADLFIQEIERDLTSNLIYKEFLQKGFIPIDMLSENKNVIRVNLQNRGYIKREESTKVQIDKARKRCYEMTDLMKKEIGLTS